MRQASAPSPLSRREVRPGEPGLAEGIPTALFEDSEHHAGTLDPLLAERIMPLDHARKVLALLIDWCDRLAGAVPAGRPGAGRSFAKRDLYMVDSRRELLVGSSRPREEAGGLGRNGDLGAERSALHLPSHCSAAMRGLQGGLR